MIKKTLMAGIAMVAFAGVASAADMATKAAPQPVFMAPALGSWTGWYLAGMVGYGYDLTSTVAAINGGAPNTVALANLGSAPNGFTGGGKLGYDIQGGNWVIGWSTSINGANFNGNGNIASSVAALASGVTTNWWGDVDARIGYTGLGNHWMPYVTGGVAYGGTKATFSCTACSTTTTALSNGIANTSIGWDAGAGIEVRLDKNWSVFGEGKYIALGTQTVTLPTGATGTGNTVMTSSQKFNFGVFDIGIKYLF